LISISSCTTSAGAATNTDGSVHLTQNQLVVCILLESLDSGIFEVGQQGRLGRSEGQFLIDSLQGLGVVIVGILSDVYLSHQGLNQSVSSRICINNLYLLVRGYISNVLRNSIDCFCLVHESQSFLFLFYNLSLYDDVLILVW
jgi:hypothetical protein